MTYEEFKRRLGKAGLTIRELAELLKLHPSSITNYSCRGIVPSHLAVIVTLMAEMAEHGIDFRHALCGLKIEPNKNRGAASVEKFLKSKQIASIFSEPV